MNQLIPKIIHQIHLGDKNLSKQELEWQEGWRRLNPSWQYIMWDDKKIKNELRITHTKILQSCKSFSEKSDILRFEILHQFGGL